MLLDELNHGLAGERDGKADAHRGDRTAVAAFGRHKRSDQKPRADVEEFLLPQFPSECRRPYTRIE
jgi:hypothetical protein